MRDSYSFRKPYLQLKASVPSFFQSTVHSSWAAELYPRSLFEKPYLDMSYPEMQLKIPEPDWPGWNWEPPEYPDLPEMDYPDLSLPIWPPWPDIEPLPDPETGPWPDWPSYPWPEFPPYPEVPWPEFGPWPDPSNPIPGINFGDPSIGVGEGDRCNACTFGMLPGFNDCDSEIWCHVQAECVRSHRIGNTTIIHPGASCTIFRYGGSLGQPATGEINSLGDYAFAGMARINSQITSAFTQCPKGDPGWHVWGDYLEARLEHFGEDTCHLFILPDCNRKDPKIGVMYITMLCDDCTQREAVACGMCSRSYYMDYETCNPDPSQRQLLEIKYEIPAFDDLEGCKNKFRWEIESGGGSLSVKSGLSTYFTAPSETDTTVINVICTDHEAPEGVIVATEEFVVMECEEADPVEFATLDTSMEAGTGQDVTITGGIPPYTWSIDDDPTGWSWQKTTTTKKENRLALASNADCEGDGLEARVRVTDFCETEDYADVVNEDCGPTEEECDEAGAVTITSPTDADAVVSPGGSLALAAEGGIPPYTWTITTYGTDGSDWSLDDEETEDGDNAINLASGSSCAENGARVKIEVTDSCGAYATTDTIYIRNSQGKWTAVETRYGVQGGSYPCAECGHFTVDLVVGYTSSLTRWRVVQTRCVTRYTGGVCNCPVTTGAWAGSGTTPPCLPVPCVNGTFGDCVPADSLTGYCVPSVPECMDQGLSLASTIKRETWGC